MSATVTAVVKVAVNPLAAFESFTQSIGSWWVRDPRYQFMPGGKGVLRFEDQQGGRLVEEGEHGTFEVGKITHWQPGVVLGFTWRAPNFSQDQETQVMVEFHPISEGTKVVLKHSGWENIPAHHPVRHGMPNELFMRNRGHWWLNLLKNWRNCLSDGAMGRDC